MRLTKTLGVFAFVAIFSLGFISCGGFSEKAAEKMVEKYEDGDMKKDDFSRCIDWVEEYYQEVANKVDKAISESKNEKRFEKTMEDLGEKMEDKWDGVDDVIEMLNEASYDEDKDMGASNIKRWEKVRDKFSDKIGKSREKAKKKFND